MARASEREEDFRQFVEAHWLGLVRSAYLLVGGDHGEAEDLVQQTLARVYGHWNRRVREGAPVAYVRKAMVNQAISNLRRKKVQEVLSSAWSGEVDTTPEPRAVRRDVPGSRDPYGAVEDRDVVVRALRELPPRMRAVVVLRFFDDLTEAATADVLGMSVGSVKSQTSRGLQRLRAAMSDQEVVGGRTATDQVSVPSSGAAVGLSRDAGRPS
ncbi:SigE family RNA polymerase sigma factor [Nostocoides sp. F2B08]|uniref:SigE family RNA polymerase sigma factor n=1 Tax=Nostocoides sp. F2B08 TaxID=2653936 RepID=UPI0012633C9B|nr:SigE family RNA polymerase sigma factor [Tetrasphaera sp. F2B08]KAB7746415.1 SigE family RNA polymerase sigma factor [Tetrasphaera sp. F2B08]